ncbi:MAG TPA: 2-amino-4-hydroxy-6-hydroxymethyldihydropteridine diphosphokinase [Vicinamibacterales bacterium]|nr:2-amino-4-hydroxy-6-hydroxymethyldihydropteridine diphosphokinase [Vicinamibacterales bacterium]
MPSTLAAIALGSNLGDRRAAIAFAADRLAAHLSSPVLSDLIETEPEGEGLQSQPLYLNAVLVGETTLTPRQLLDLLLQIETEHGRTRPFPGAPRTLDLDLILLGDTVVNQPGLELPHPRFRERFFVLGPLAEVAPEMRDPVTGLKVTELLKALLKDETR